MSCSAYTKASRSVSPGSVSWASTRCSTLWRSSVPSRSRKEPHSTGCCFRHPPTPSRIGRVVITGLEQVDTGTVRKMLSVHPSDLFRQDRVYQSQRDLYGMGVFRSVNVVLADSAPRPGDSTVTVLVRVAEGPRHRVRV